MEHTLAHETYAAERYLLGEMAPDERDEFEEHFFGCRVCGENVQAVSVFAENAKAVFRDESLKISPASQRAGSWLNFNWLHSLRLPVFLPSFAALALAVIVSYQNAVVIPQLQSVQSMASPVILDGETRAAMLPAIKEGAPLRFQMLLVHPTSSDRILVDVIDAAGKTARSGSVDTPALDRPLDVYFPGRLRPGRYSLVARSAHGGDAGQELGRNQFQIVTSPE